MLQEQRSTGGSVGEGKGEAEAMRKPLLSLLPSLREMSCVFVWADMIVSRVS